MLAALTFVALLPGATITGTSSSEEFYVGIWYHAGKAIGPGYCRVSGLSTNCFTLANGPTEFLTVNANGGNDTIELANTPGGNISLGFDEIRVPTSPRWALITVNGGSGIDTIIGSNYGDVLNGGTGDDTIVGNGGNDTIGGSTVTSELCDALEFNSDQCWGDAGSDNVFCFNFASGEADTGDTCGGPNPETMSCEIEDPC